MVKYDDHIGDVHEIETLPIIYDDFHDIGGGGGGVGDVGDVGDSSGGDGDDHQVKAAASANVSRACEILKL